MSSRAPSVVDSSVWIEIFSGGPLEKRCEEILSKVAEILVPTICIFEVYRKIAASVSEDVALSVIAHLKQFKCLDLTSEIALVAADLSLEHKLAMADSVVLAHARARHGELLTLDNDFSGIEQVRVIRAG